MIFLRVVVILLWVYVLMKTSELENEIAKLKQRTNALKLLLDAARGEVKVVSGSLLSDIQQSTPLSQDSEIIEPVTAQEWTFVKKPLSTKKIDLGLSLDVKLWQPKVKYFDQPRVSKATTYQPNFSWITDNRQMKLWAFIFLLGLIWWVSYAFINNRIWPVGRILLGVWVWVWCMILGSYRMKQSHDQWSVFIGLWMVCAIISLYLGKSVYGFFSSTQLLVLSLIPVWVTSFLAVYHDSKRLALVSLVVGLIAPLFAHTDHHWMWLIGYLFVLSIWVVVQIAHRREWRELNIISLVWYLLYTGIILWGLTGSVEGSSIAFLFPTFMFLLFFIVHVLDLVAQEKEIQLSSLVLPVLNACLYLWRIPQVTANEHISIVLFFVAALFGVVVYLLSTYTNWTQTYKKPLMVYLPLAILFLAIATAYEFSWPVLVLAYLLEITALIISVARVAKKPLVSMYLGILYIVPLFLGADSFMAASWNTGILHSDMIIVSLFVVVSIWLVVIYDHYRDKKSEVLGLYDSLHTVYFLASIVWWTILIALMSKSLFVEWIATVSYVGQLALIWGVSVYGLYSGKRLWSQILMMWMLIVWLIWMLPLTGESGWIPFGALLGGALIYLWIWRFHSRHSVSQEEAPDAIFVGPVVPVLMSLLVAVSLHVMIVPLAVWYELELQSVLMMLFVWGVTAVLVQQSYRDTLKIPMGVISGVVWIYTLSVMSGWSWMTGIGSAWFLVVALQGLFFLGLARFMSTTGTPDESQRTLAATQYGVATLIGLWLVWNALELTLANDQLANTIALVLYSIWWIIWYVQWTNRSMPWLKRCSGLLVLLVVADLLLIQVRVMTLGWRIVTFLAVGIVLLMSAYFHKKEE